MARPFSKKRKQNRISFYIGSDCMREFIQETAQSKSVLHGRYISMSKVMSEIIREKMNELGWDCN